MSSGLIAVLVLLPTIWVLGMVGFLAWKFRYYYLKNRFRVVFINETGAVFNKVLKLTPSAENFAIKTVPGQYKIMRDRIYSTGGYRMPTSYYLVGNDTPKDMKEIAEGSVSSIRFREVAKQKVMTDLLTSFQKRVIDNLTAMIITIGVTVVLIAILGVFMNDKLNGISEQLANPSNVPVVVQPTAVPAVR